MGYHGFVLAPGEGGANTREQERWRDIGEHVRCLTLENDGVVPDFLAGALAEALRCERFGAYRPEQSEDGSWGVRMHGNVNFSQPWIDTYNALLRQTSTPYLFNPLHPQREQRNRVCLLEELHTHGPGGSCHVEEVWPKVGLADRDQIRVLVCEGATVLAWVGGFRAEPFTERERRLFASIVPALRHALSLRRRLVDAEVAKAGLAAALEAMGAPAFVLRANGDVIHANAAARALLERWGRSSANTLRSILRQPGLALVAPIVCRGVSRCSLLVFREPRAAREARLLAAAAQWSLTGREIDVLRLLVEGDSNKEIALKLSCAEVTVERHVTSILRKGRCDGRCRLVSRFWAA